MIYVQVDNEVTQVRTQLFTELAQAGLSCHPCNPLM